jgi:type I restriction enzyme S subunit
MFWADQDNGHAWASIADLNSEVVVETAEYISNLGVKSSNVKLVPTGTPIMSFKLTIGRTSMAGRDLYTNEAIAAFFADRVQVDPRFLFHALPGAARSVITDVAIKGATLNKKSLSSMQLLLPSIGEQRRIAEILDALDDQIRLTTSIISKLQLAQAGLLADLLTGDGGKAEGARHPTNLPNGWEVVTCRDLCTEITVGIVVRPSQYYRDIGVPMLRSANVRAEGLVLKDLKYMDPTDHARMTKTSVRPGDLVTVRTGYPGTTAVIPNELAEANCIDIIISRPASRVLSEYLTIWINSEFGRGQVLRSQGGLAQQHFNVAEMNSLRVALPPLPRQQEIVDIWSGCGAHVRLEKRRLSKLQLLKVGLLADLLTGRVRAPSEVAS